MRTTITLDEESAEIAAAYAHSRNVSLSKAINELILRGTRRAPRIRYENGLPIFDVPESTKPITTERVKALEAEEY